MVRRVCVARLRVVTYDGHQTAFYRPSPHPLAHSTAIVSAAADGPRAFIILCIIIFNNNTYYHTVYHLKYVLLTKLYRSSLKFGEPQYKNFEYEGRARIRRDDDFGFHNVIYHYNILPYEYHYILDGY